MQNQEYLEQYSQWQKRLFETWLDGFGKEGNSRLLSANWEQVINSQEKTLKILLEIQAKTAELMIESQKQLWYNYFENIRMAWAVNKKEELDIPLKLSTTTIKEAFSLEYEPQPDNN